MKQSESISKLLENFTKAQAEFKTLSKDKQGYGYKYTDLDTVISSVRPVLAKYGLGFMQTLTSLEGGKSAITTRLFSSDGEYLEDTIGLPDVAMAKTNSAQNLGAAITYMKRYALCAMLGISSDEDTDAEMQRPAPQQKQNSAPQQKQNQPKAKPQPQQPAGGADTPEQHAEINNLLGAMYQNGAPIFSREEIGKIGSWRMSKTADEVIKYLKEQIAGRRSAQQKPATAEQALQPELSDSQSFDEMSALF